MLAVAVVGLLLCVTHVHVSAVDIDKVHVNVTRVSSQLRELSRISDADPPAVTRVLYSRRDIEARAYLRGVIQDAGLALREDAVGNMFATLPGSDAAAGVVGTGSHYDAIPESGMYDGTVGVLGGIEALRALRKAGVKIRRSLEVLAFTSEEPTRFGLSCIGSRSLVGQKSPEDFKELRDAHGISFDDARREAGYVDALDTVELPDGYFSSFVELHIEQGPVLERELVDIGIVTAIAGPESATVTFEGPGGHAGGVMMKDRHDATLAGAEFALAVEKVVLELGTDDTVGTSGVFAVEPGAENSIGRRVKVSLDARDINGTRRDSVVEAARNAASDIAMKRGVKMSFESRSRDSPATCAGPIVEAIQRSAERAGATHMKLVSRAYHDSLLMAQRFPVGMIFIPCRAGVSHHPSEFSSDEQIKIGVQTLAGALVELGNLGDEQAFVPHEEL